MIKKVASLLAVVAFAGWAGTATALPILNIENGQLVGASGVDVNGTLYDVMFVGGSCISVFDGCDEDADFTFHSLGAASLASGALLAQVFLDRPDAPMDFDSLPYLINGCSSARLCDAFTPYALVTFPNTVTGGVNYAVRIAYAANFGLAEPNDHDRLENTVQPIDRSFGAEETFAVWSIQSVPEPATLALMGLGLAGIAFMSWRRLEN